MSSSKSLSFVPSKNFSTFVSENLIGVVCTTSESGIITVSKSSEEDKLNVWLSSFEECGALHHNSSKLVVSTFFGIAELNEVTKPMKDQKTKVLYTSSYIPRQVSFIGDIQVRDMLVVGGEVYFISSLMNGVCKLGSDGWSVVYRPSFVTSTIPEDRCHITGICSDGEDVKYISVTSQTDYCDGWKDHLINGGVVIDIHSNEVVCSGLTLPHSPRTYNNKLYLLDSGTGRFGWINFEEEPSRRFTPITFIPGFLRGLRIVDDYAIIGVSVVTNSTLPVFMEIERLGAVMKCGLKVVNLHTTSIEHWLDISEAGEIVDIDVIENVETTRVMDMSLSTLRGMYAYN